MPAAGDRRLSLGLVLPKAEQLLSLGHHGSHPLSQRVKYLDTGSDANM